MFPAKRRNTDDGDTAPTAKVARTTADSDATDTSYGDAPLTGPVVRALPSHAELRCEHAALLQQLDGSYDSFKAILTEFLGEFNKDPTQSKNLVIADDAAWFWFLEMRFLVIFLYEMTFAELALSVTRPDVPTAVAAHERTERVVHRCEMQQRVEFLARMKRYLCDLGQARCEATEAANVRLPRIVRLCKRYKLTDREIDLFELLVVLQGCQSNAARSQFIEKGAQRRMVLLQRLTGMAAIDLAELCDGRREHIQDGTLIVGQGSYASLSLSHSCVRMMLGRHMTKEQELGLNQTALKDLLVDEGIKFAAAPDATTVDHTDEADHKHGGDTKITKIKDEHSTLLDTAKEDHRRDGSADGRSTAENRVDPAQRQAIDVLIAEDQVKAKLREVVNFERPGL